MRIAIALTMLAALGSGCNGPKEGATQPAQHATAPASTKASRVEDVNDGQSEAKRLPAVLLEQMPQPEVCTASQDLFVTPKAPAIGVTLRVVAVLEEHSSNYSLQLWDKQGAPIKAERVVAFGGPPYGQMVQIDATSASTITAALGRNGQVIACQKFDVRPSRVATERRVSEVWPTTRSWDQRTEALWAFFVQALFDYPLDDTRTWSNLHDLIRDPERNILFDYLGLGEETSLTLEPDCADLPYQLRAYFAWKLGLPFAFRWCSRGAVAEPPRCGPFRTNEIERERSSDAGAFEHFAQRVVRPGVHSASGRTHPKDNRTDLYPVSLTRAALAPGTVYADPYGHVMILTQWVPQRGDESGILMAAEAQPDGTVGRRRFWRGSFLFEPDTTHVGAGFKLFRPLVLQNGKTVALSNDTLKNHTAFTHYSQQQYKITRDQFYDQMDALINPEPLDPEKRLLALVDAFDESVQRRVTAVQNGEDYITAQGSIAMPHGHAIFETAGPWEDYSSPSRDMRLLISLDTVTEFVDRVRRQPARFGVAKSNLQSTVKALQSFLRKELKQRHISYVRSDGSAQELTLREVVHRAEALEMAYNPNDCIELRWGAPQNSPEQRTCKRHAPEEQRARMRRYRGWFSERKRPARGTE